jgi:hypothetical protein
LKPGAGFTRRIVNATCPQLCLPASVKLVLNDAGIEEYENEQNQN